MDQKAMNKLAAGEPDWDDHGLPKPFSSDEISGEANPIASSLADRLFKKHGKGSVEHGRGVRLTIPGVIPTGCLPLDAAIGRGGIPLGRWTILTGDEGTGKTTLSVQIAAACQRMGGVVFYQDTENKLDLQYAAHLGLNLNDVVVGHPQHVEESFEMTAEAVELIREVNLKSDVMIPGVVILDSLNTTISTIEYDAEFTDKPRPGGHAAAVSRAIAKLNQRIGAAPIAIILVSQIRNLIKTTPYGPSTNEISGGRAGGFIASLVIRLIRMGTLKKNERPYGQEVKAIIRKSQISVPFGEAVFHLIWGEGTDPVQGLLSVAAARGIVNIGTGRWFELPDVDGKTVKWQGELGFLKAEEKNPGLRKVIEGRLSEKQQVGKPISTRKSTIVDEGEEDPRDGE